MTKKPLHIHIYGALPTRDEGTKHDPKNGQFTSGPAGGSAEHHRGRAQAHHEAMSEKGAVHPDAEHHAAARAHHFQAAQQLGHAASSGGVKGNEHRAMAQKHANSAAESETKISATPAAPNPAPAKPTLKVTPGETWEKSRPSPRLKRLPGEELGGSKTIPLRYRAKAAPNKAGAPALAPWEGRAPFEIKHEGKEYTRTGKEGTHHKSGTPTAEYEQINESDGKRNGIRVWHRQTGHVDPD